MSGASHTKIAFQIGSAASLQTPDERRALTTQNAASIVGDGELALQLANESEFLSGANLKGAIFKFVRAHLGSGREAQTSMVGQMGAAFVGADFISHAQKQAESGGLAFLHKALPSPVLTPPELKGLNNRTQGLNLWISFVTSVDDPSIRPAVEALLWKALQEEVAGWHIRTIYVQAYQDREALERLGFQAGGDSRLLMAESRNQFHEGFLRSAFCWRVPIYNLTDEQKGVLMLAAQGMDLDDIRDFYRGLRLKPPKLPGLFEDVRNQVRDVHPDALAKRATWTEVVRFLRSNPWELRPFTNV